MKSIGSHTFKGCSGLLSVIIGSGVQTILSWAFAYCQVLEDGVTGGQARCDPNRRGIGGDVSTDIFFAVGVGLVDDGLRPEGDVVGVALKRFAVGGAVEQARQLVVYGIIVNVGAVNEGDGLCHIGERLVVARDNLRDGHLVAAVHVALRNAGHIDGGIGRADVEQPDEEAGILGLAEKLPGRCCRD